MDNNKERACAIAAGTSASVLDAAVLLFKEDPTSSARSVVDFAAHAMQMAAELRRLAANGTPGFEAEVELTGKVIDRVAFKVEELKRERAEGLCPR